MYEVVAALIASSATRRDEAKDWFTSEDRYYERLGTPLPQPLYAALHILARLAASIERRRPAARDRDCRRSRSCYLQPPVRMRQGPGARPSRQTT